jgi:hypothetical protein
MKPKPTITFFIFLIAFLFFLPPPIQAEERIESDNYRITWPNLNMGAGAPTSSNYNLGVTMGQLAPGLYTSTGYKVRAGFQYIHSIIPFSFTISDLTIAFGTLSAGTPKTETNTLTVSAGGAGGYQVTAEENNPLTSSSNATIPDTTCDGSDCDETSAGVWSQNSTYGFGFNMTGNDIPSDFIDSTYFRQFADASSPEDAQIVMSSTNVAKSRQSTVTYKVNVSATQAAGNYQNIITFICTPFF